MLINEEAVCKIFSFFFMIALAYMPGLFNLLMQ